MKIVVNRKYGGYGLSPEALLILEEMKSPAVKKYKLTNKEWPMMSSKKELEHLGCALSKCGKYVICSNRNEDSVRNDPALIEVVEKLGKAANGNCANLQIVKIPDDVDWVIGEYDGFESIDEKHRSW